jgi:transaldolase
LGPNVYAKLPVTTTRAEPLLEAVKSFSHHGVNVNMTAVFTGEQAVGAVDALAGAAPACVSVFAGRMADLSIDYRPSCSTPSPGRKTKNVEIVWASTREVFNVIEADSMGCHIITAPPDILQKLRPARSCLSMPCVHSGTMRWLQGLKPQVTGTSQGVE